MATKATKEVNVRGKVNNEVNVAPTNIYRGTLRISQKTESRSSTESRSQELIEDRDILVNASPSNIIVAFDKVIEDLLSNYANADMVKISLIEYRDLSTDNLCYTVV